MLSLAIARGEMDLTPAEIHGDSDAAAAASAIAESRELRHLKVIGIFARICHRDGKPRYLADVPRFFAYIEAVLARRPELGELRQLIAELPKAPQA